MFLSVNRTYCLKLYEKNAFVIYTFVSNKIHKQVGLYSILHEEGWEDYIWWVECLKEVYILICVSSLWF